MTMRIRFSIHKNKLHVVGEAVHCGIAHRRRKVVNVCDGCWDAVLAFA